MKKRYLLLPFLIISMMILILKYENRYPISKELLTNFNHIVYPYFNNKKIDDKINNYLDNIIDNNYDYLYIYYDIKKDGNTYIISLYIYKEYRNMIKRKVDVLEVTRR